MRVKTSAAIAGFLLVATSVSAFNEPDGLQVLQFGQDVRNILPKCDTLGPAEKYVEVCWRQHDQWRRDESKLNVENIIIGETVLRTVQVEMIEDKLEYITGTFPGAKFSEMAAGMFARYGKPSVSTTNAFQNAFGMKVTYPAYRWSGKKVSVNLAEMPLNTKETLGRFSFQTPRHAALEGAEEASRTEKAAKGL